MEKVNARKPKSSSTLTCRDLFHGFGHGKKALEQSNRFLVHEFCSEPLEFYADPLQWWDLRLEKVNMQGTQNLKSYLLVGRKFFHGFGHDNKALEQQISNGFGCKEATRKARSYNQICHLCWISLLLLLLLLLLGKCPAKGEREETKESCRFHLK